MDTTRPVITLNGDANITHEAGDAYVDAGAYWMDIVDGDMPTSTGEVTSMCPGPTRLVSTTQMQATRHPRHPYVDGGHDPSGN